MTILIDQLNQVYKDISGTLRVPVGIPILGSRYELSGKVYSWDATERLWKESLFKLRPMYFCGQYSPDYKTPEYAFVSRKNGWRTQVYHEDKKIADQIKALSNRHQSTPTYDPKTYLPNANYAAVKNELMDAIKAQGCYILGKSTKVYK